MENEVNNIPETQPAAVPETQPASVSKSKTGLIIISLTAAVLVIAGVFAWYTNATVKPGSSTTTPAVSTTGSSLEDDVNAITVESNDSDFSNVDKDLQAL